MSRESASGDEFFEFLNEVKKLKILGRDSTIVHFTTDPDGREWRNAISFHLGPTQILKSVIDFYLTRAGIPLEEFWGE